MQHAITIGVVAEHDSVHTSSCVSWLDWGIEAFQRARAEHQPILLALGTSWCRWSAAMVRETYDDPTVADLIHERFVPIWVDADRRPDINERYNLGAWPTTAFLTPDGHLLGGETYVTADRMSDLLQRVADTFAAKRHEITARAAQSVPARVASATTEPDVIIEEWLVDHMLNLFDSEHGGFGTGAKRVHAEAIQFAIDRSRQGDGALAPIAERTIEAIGWSDLHDPVDGGVYRYCAKRDWTEPSFEKVLDVNAAVLGLLVDGDDSRVQERAVDLLGYVGRTLIDQSDGGFFVSQYGDESYYGATTPEARRLLEPPRVDRSVYADGTARMAAAYVRAAQVFNDSSLLEFAVLSLERVVLDSYERGGGIAHQVGDSESVRGLLADQVRISSALLELYGATDRDVYLDMAQELMRYALRRLWDAEPGGGFFDRIVVPDDVGLLREPLKPFAPNCEAAQVLARLAQITEQPDLRQQAVSTLASQNNVARGYGVDAAPYVLALRELASV